MEKAVIYIRVSTEDQKNEGYSPAAQLKLLQDYAAKKDYKVIKVFEDTETAKKAGREHFNIMLNFLRENDDTKIILCEKTDRLYRNFKDYVTIGDLDLEIHFVKENEILSKTSNSHQKLVHGMKLVIAKNYIDNLSEETIKGMLEKAEQGKYPSFAPLGYINNLIAKSIELDTTRAPFIEKIFMWRLEDNSLSLIANLAYEAGLRNRNGKKVGKSGIEKVLKNPFYYGTFRWKGILHAGSHTPIISKELFNAVQNTFKINKGFRQSERHFAYTGFLTCGKCGCSITAEEKKNKYIYYHCTGFKGKCGAPYLREEKLSEQFGEIVKKIQIDEGILELVKNALLEENQNNLAYYGKQTSTLKARKTKLEERLSQLFLCKIDKEISEEFYKKQVGATNKELNTINEGIARSERINPDYVNQGIKILELCNSAYGLYLEKSSMERAKLLRCILSNCTLDNVTLCPTYRKPFDLIAKGLSRLNWLPLKDSNLGPSGYTLTPIARRVGLYLCHGQLQL